MAILELLPHYLIAPLLGLAGYGFVMAAVGGRGGRPEAGVLGRKLVLLMLPATAAIFGLVLLILGSELAQDSQRVATLRLMGDAFSIVALSAVVGMTYQIYGAVPVLERRPEMFGRNLVLHTLPVDAFLFGFVGSFLVLGVLSSDVPVELGPGLLSGPLLWFALIGVGGLLSGLLAGAVAEREEFLRRLIRGTIASGLTVVGFSVFFLSLQV